MARSLTLVGEHRVSIGPPYYNPVSAIFAVPMLLTERTDALSAMGISMAMVWANLPVMLAWGAIVLGLFLVSIATAFVGLIVVFPMLGHATWHAYRAIRPDDRQEGDTERMFIRPAE